MREIKFRAFNIKKEIMCYNNEDQSAEFWDSVYCSTLRLINSRFEKPEYDWDFTAQYYVMQYTGLKDKNGVEIYEGDLIFGNGLLKPYELFWSTYHAEWHVRRRTNDEGWKIDLLHSSSYEVIGNIHEHKHLLEG